MSGRKAVILIDGGYLRGDRDTPEEEVVEVQALLPAIVSHVRGIHSLAIRYYDCMPYMPELPTEIDKFRYEQQARMLDAMKRAGITVSLGRMLKPPSERPRQKGVDVSIAIDLVEIAYKRIYEMAVLVSNDGDFHPALKKARDNGLTVGVVFLDFGERAKVNYRLGKSASFEVKLRRKSLETPIDIADIISLDKYPKRNEGS